MSFSNRISYSQDEEDPIDDNFNCKLHNYEPIQKICVYPSCPNNILCWQCLQSHEIHPGVQNDYFLNIYQFHQELSDQFAEQQECQKLLNFQSNSFQLWSEEQISHLIQWKVKLIAHFDNIIIQLQDLFHQTIISNYNKLKTKMSQLESLSDTNFMQPDLLAVMLDFYNTPLQFKEASTYLIRQQDVLSTRLNEFFIKFETICKPFLSLEKDVISSLMILSKIIQIQEICNKTHQKNVLDERVTTRKEKLRASADIQLMCNFIGNDNVIRSCLLLPDGDYATASRDKTISFVSHRIWCGETQQCKQIIKDHLNWVQDLINLPGMSFCSCSDDKKIKIFGKSLFQPQNEMKKTSLLTVQFQQQQPNRKSLKQQEAEQLQWVCLMTLVGHESYVMRVLYSTFQNMLVSCSTDGTLKLWSFTTKLEELCNSTSCENPLHKQYKFETLVGHDNQVYSIQISKNSEYSDWIVSGDEGGQIIKWSISKRQIMIKQAEAHLGCVNYIQVLEDGNIMSCGDDKSIKIWDDNLQLIKIISLNRSELECFTFINNDLFIGGDEQGYLVLISKEKGEVILEVPGHKDRIFRIEYYHQKKQICTASADHTAKVWSLD